MYEIRRLGKNDEKMLNEALKSDTFNNLFMLANIKNFGFRDPDIYFWGSFKFGKLTGVLMKYRYSYSIYDHGGADYEEFANMIKERKDIKYLLGKSDYIHSLMKHIRDMPIESYTTQEFCKLEKVLNRELPHIPKKATKEDIEKIVSFYKNSDRMERTAQHLHKSLNNTRYFIMETENEVVSSVCTNAELDDLAMVGGLYTIDKYRNRGYGSSCLQYLCDELIKEKKIPCVFYNITLPNDIYKRIGFEKIGQWEVVTFS